MPSPSHLAALRTHESLAKVTGFAEPKAAANQNGAPTVSEDILVAALRHFGEHGLGAAREALVRADAAFTDGDNARAREWLEIARALDRRMVAKFEHQRECG